MVASKPGHRRLARFTAAFAALPLALLMAGTAPAAAQSRDPLQAAFNVAIANPTNVEAQLAYARAAERAGKFEAAFPVYERVLALDPGNREAKDGLARIRAQIQPSRFETFVEVGTQYESNPLRVTPGSPTNGEFQLFGNVLGKYENTLGMRRWRTEARLNGLMHFEQTQLNYGYAGAITGPLVDLGPNSVVHLALGGGISSFSGRLFYTEALASAVVEWGAGGAQQTVRMRAAWRQYDPFWVSDNGLWADITGKFIAPQATPGTAFVATPWLRYSGINGTFTTFDPINIFDPFNIAPGRYAEAGGQLQYVTQLARNLSASISVAANARQYLVDVVPATTTARRDFTLTPGANLVLSNLMDGKVDLRLRYAFTLNDSNDNMHDFRDHIVSLGIGGKF